MDHILKISASNHTTWIPTAVQCTHPQEHRLYKAIGYLCPCMNLKLGYPITQTLSSGMVYKGIVHKNGKTK
jgi:hypothetical protein